MTAYDKYIELEKETDKLLENHDLKKVEEMMSKRAYLRNTSFTKADWLKLIEHVKGSKRAVYEYTRMMKEKFPD